MKIAVLSDIHANNFALEAVLEDIKSCQVDKLIIAGDYIGDGPQPSEVLRNLRSMNAWIIKGNKEQKILNYHKGKCSDWDKHNQMLPLVWAYKQLSEDLIDYIDYLPEQLRIEIPGADAIRVVHGSPYRIDESLYQYECRDRIIESVTDIDESVLVCGHTHIPWHENINGRLILNPGSVGVNFNEQLDAEYALLVWTDNGWEVEHRLVPYDKEELEKEFYRSGLMDFGGALAKAALYSVKYKKDDVVSDFVKYAYFLAESRGISHGLIPNGIWKEAEEAWDWSLCKGISYD